MRNPDPARPDLGGYDEVATRIRAFYQRFPAGSIQTELASLEGDRAVFRATVYRRPDDPNPVTGWAEEREGGGERRNPRFLEHCETMAVGRALANLGLTGTRRPSREEMEKVARLGPRRTG